MAARYLSLITSQIRPNLNNAQKFRILQLPNQIKNVNEKVGDVLYRSISNLFLCIPEGQKATKEEWEERSRGFQEFMQPIVMNVFQFFEINLGSRSDQEQIRQGLFHCFRVIRSVSFSAKNGTLQARLICFNAIFPAIKVLLDFFAVFKTDAGKSSLSRRIMFLNRLGEYVN
jgi:hypothetical protein